MKSAQQKDWKTEELPLKHSTITLNRRFSAADVRKIRTGLVPRQMEDKWFIFWKRNTLYFHRSWTGYCIYVARFVKDGDSYILSNVDVNRDPNQYTETNDKRDAKMISYLIDVLLLHHNAVFPSDDPSIERRVITEWGQVGRAMFGQHPDSEGAEDSFYFPICNKCVHYHRNLSDKITCDVHSDCIPSTILAGDETCDQWRGKEH